MARAQQGMLGAALALAAAWQLLHLPGAHATHPLQSPFAGIFEGYPPNLVRPARDLDAADYTRRTLRFPCSGESCEAWLYLPKATGSCTSRGLPPVVVAAHGLGGQKDFSLHAYGAAFSTAGLAVFMFDYRNYGGSTGEPRLWVSPKRHLEDWLSAVAYVQANLTSTVDASRLALWGTSFSGGHVLVTAAKLGPAVKAVVSQVPHLSGPAANAQTLKRMGPKSSAMLTAAALADATRLLLSSSSSSSSSNSSARPPYYVPVAGPPGSLAFMQLDAEEQRDYLKLHPKGKAQGGWQNMARASLSLELSLTPYSPKDALPHVAAPIHFTAARYDSLCPLAVMLGAVKTAPSAQLVVLDANHFQPYKPPFLAGVLANQTAFLKEHLGCA